jgi:carboxymethylenebutenolidase
MTTKVELGGIEGALATPASKGPWPALIVIHEWWGLDKQTIGIAERFAKEGYLAFAPDLYHGELAALGDYEKAKVISQRHSPGAPAGLAGVFDALSKRGDSTGRVGSVGFCFGGRMSLELGIERPLSALCTFYGGGMQTLFDRLDRLPCPVLGLFGDKDQSIPAGTIEEFDRLLDRIGVEHEIVVYPDSGHAFFRDSDPSVYRPVAAKDAWRKTKAFFAKNLG